MKKLNYLDKFRSNIKGYPAGDSGNGAFVIRKQGNLFKMIASNGGGWDHVSISIERKKRCPTWEEMCWVKDLFFEEGEAVIQVHPATSEYVNNHAYCLHLWRDQSGTDLPPSIMVGITKTDIEKMDLV